jgi:excisionase family DNA binding protein
MNEILLTVRDVANYFAVSKQTVARWYKSGQLQSMRIGGGVRFTRQHIADLIGTNEKERQQV